jgi:hypothetical protein
MDGALMMNFSSCAQAASRKLYSVMLDQKDDFGEDRSSILLWKISYTYTNENPYCEACRADFGVAEVKPVQLK